MCLATKTCPDHHDALCERQTARRPWLYVSLRKSISGKQQGIKVLSSWALGSSYPIAGDPSVGFVGLSIGALFTFTSLVAIFAGGNERGIVVTAAICSVSSSLGLFVKSFYELAGGKVFVCSSHYIQSVVGLLCVSRLSSTLWYVYEHISFLRWNWKMVKPVRGMVTRPNNAEYKRLEENTSRGAKFFCDRFLYDRHPIDISRYCTIREKMAHDTAPPPPSPSARNLKHTSGTLAQQVVGRVGAP